MEKDGGLDWPDMVPGELRALPQWLIYRIEVRKGKQTKVPYWAARPSLKASATDPATWATFEEAFEARDRADGLGFVFTEDDPFIGVDLDACRDPATGEVHPAAAEIVSRLASYTEVSPSGTGLHVIGRGMIGGGRRTGRTPWGGEFEIYDRARYFTITGQPFNGATPGGLVDLVDLDAVRAELVPDVVAPARPARGLVRLEDHELLEKAFEASNGPKLRALWEGDTSAYGSPSEAELALCSMLAFWTGPDPDRVDWLFRQSGLVREKWEQREDYRRATISKALAGRSEFYGDRTGRLAAVAGDDPLAAASAAIRMEEVPLVAADEQRNGRVVLERADGQTLRASSLGSLAVFTKLAGELAAQFGHELAVEKGQGTATAHRFVAALRRHFGPGQVRADEERFEGWMIELAQLAMEIEFEAGDAESRLRAWRTLDNLDPEEGSGARGYAAKLAVAHDLTTGDRYLRAMWVQEYVRRCGYRGSTEDAVGMLEAVGLEQPNPRSGGRVRAQWRAGGDTLVLRFWVVPPQDSSGGVRSGCRWGSVPTRVRVREGPLLSMWKYRVRV